MKGENRIQPRNVQQPGHVSLRWRQDQTWPALRGNPDHGEQSTQPRRVNELQVAKIEHDRLPGLLAQVKQLVTERGAGVQIELSDSAEYEMVGPGMNFEREHESLLTVCD